MTTSPQNKRIAVTDDELVLLIFGLRRLQSKLSGDERHYQRKGIAGLVFEIGRQRVQTRQLQERFVDIARSRGILDRVTTRASDSE